MLNGSGTWQRTNVYGAGKLLATYDVNGLHFHLTDPLGTRRVQVSGNSATAGLAETDCESLPFGDQLNCFPDPNSPITADDATPLHFTSKERDTETGNDYFGARYLASTVGRFLTPDWSAKIEPVPYAKMDNPQSLNLYAYVGNNPLGGEDTDGHDVSSALGSCDTLCDASNGHNDTRNVWVQTDWSPGNGGGTSNFLFAAQQQKPKTMNEIAMYAEESALKLTRESVKNGDYHEYGGLILQSEANGQYTFTKPRKGTEGNFDSDSIPVPEGFKTVGEYHTHPHNSPSDIPGPSPGDIYRLRTPELANRIGYVADSYTGQVYRYTQSEPVKGPYDLGIYGTKIGTIP